jgi:hypothetical protein
MVVFCEAFSCDLSIHPSISSFIHGWHHIGKKTLTKLNNPPPSAHVSLSKKGIPSPGGAPPRFWYQYQLYVGISRVTSSANIKIFSDQGPDEYVQNVIYTEGLKM